MRAVRVGGLAGGFGAHLLAARGPGQPGRGGAQSQPLSQALDPFAHRADLCRRITPNILIHDDDEVDETTLWDRAQNDLPALIVRLEAHLARQPPPGRLEEG